jgi:hypothetical protein
MPGCRSRSRIFLVEPVLNMLNLDRLSKKGTNYSSFLLFPFNLQYNSFKKKKNSFKKKKKSGEKIALTLLLTFACYKKAGAASR